MKYSQQQLIDIERRYRQINQRMKLNNDKANAIQMINIDKQLPEDLLDKRNVNDIQNDDYARQAMLNELTNKLLPIDKSYEFQENIKKSGLELFFIQNFPRVQQEARMFRLIDALTLVDIVKRLYNKQVQELDMPANELKRQKQTISVIELLKQASQTLNDLKSYASANEKKILKERQDKIDALISIEKSMKNEIDPNFVLEVFLNRMLNEDEQTIRQELQNMINPTDPNQKTLIDDVTKELLQKSFNEHLETLGSNQNSSTTLSVSNQPQTQNKPIVLDKLEILYNDLSNKTLDVFTDQDYKNLKKYAKDKSISGSDLTNLLSQITGAPSTLYNITSKDTILRSFDNQYKNELKRRDQIEAERRRIERMKQLEAERDALIKERDNNIFMHEYIFNLNDDNDIYNQAGHLSTLYNFSFKPNSTPLDLRDAMIDFFKNEIKNNELDLKNIDPSYEFDPFEDLDIDESKEKQFKKGFQSYIDQITDKQDFINKMNELLVIIDKFKKTKQTREEVSQYSDMIYQTFGFDIKNINPSVRVTISTVKANIKLFNDYLEYAINNNLDSFKPEYKEKEKKKLEKKKKKIEPSLNNILNEAKIYKEELEKTKIIIDDPNTSPDDLTNVQIYYNDMLNKLKVLETQYNNLIDQPIPVEGDLPDITSIELSQPFPRFDVNDVRNWETLENYVDANPDYNNLRKLESRLSEMFPDYVKPNKHTKYKATQERLLNYINGKISSINGNVVIKNQGISI